MSEERDLQRKTVVILLVLTVVVSVVGTWMILSTDPNIEYQDPYYREVAGSGQVNLKIVEPPKTLTSGGISMKIIPSK